MLGVPVSGFGTPDMSATSDDGLGNQRWVIMNEATHSYLRINPPGSPLEGRDAFLAVWAPTGQFIYWLDSSANVPREWVLTTVPGYTTIQLQNSICSPDPATCNYLGRDGNNIVMKAANTDDSTKWVLEPQALGSYYHIKPYVATPIYECRFFKTVQKNLLGMITEAAPQQATVQTDPAAPATTISRSGGCVPPTTPRL